MIFVLIFDDLEFYFWARFRVPDPSLLKGSGICQKRQSGLNLNSLFITLRTQDMERIPLRMGILNLLHEILHAFGAGHDPKGEYKLCEF